MTVLKDNLIARMDKWGRIRIPSGFLSIFKENLGSEVFVTSTDDRTIIVYPLAAWHAKVYKLLKGKKDDPLLRQFLMKANYNGQIAGIDRFGRVRIPSLLRGKISLEGDIAIEERDDHLVLKPVCV
jgi:DNA-binding transcriptional regulator/RsmH inhibitor MraZ